MHRQISKGIIASNDSNHIVTIIAVDFVGTGNCRMTEWDDSSYISADDLCIAANLDMAELKNFCRDKEISVFVAGTENAFVQFEQAFVYIMSLAEVSKICAAVVMRTIQAHEDPESVENEGGLEAYMEKLYIKNKLAAPDFSTTFSLSRMATTELEVAYKKK